jgi:putative chitinase
MVKLTCEQLRKILPNVPTERVNSLTDALNETFEKYEINTPLRVAHFLGQVMHETLCFHFMREIWGPTPAQERYDTRTDLGNTPEKDGDGKKYLGRGGLHATGLDMYKRLTKEYKVDFVNHPEKLEEDPWAILSAGFIWTNVKKLNTLADKDDLDSITVKINGGKNGLSGRIAQTGKVKSLLKI